MAKNNRTCAVCGKGYHYCPTCRTDMKKPRWMNMFDAEDCKTIFEVSTKFNLGKLTAFEAQDQLKECNLNMEFKPAIKNDLTNIFAATKEAAPVADDAIVVPEEPVVEEQHRKYRKHRAVDEEVVIE